MEGNRIEYTTPEQQLEKLKSQNLTIGNEAEALKALSLFGYSNLIKSYREPYVYSSGEHKIYRSGVTFEQIYSLYILDKNLRNAVMASMIDLEEFVKAAAADIIAEDFGTHPDEYLKFSNYQNKRKHLQRFTLTSLLKTMWTTLDTDKDPIHHYQEAHGTVPPWILFKSVYFSTIINFIEQFKKPQHEKLASRLYDLPSLGLSNNAARKLMMDTLFICLGYRNIAAHGGRTYNYQSPSRLRINEIFGEAAAVDLSGFSQLLFLLDLISYRNPYQRLEAELNTEVNRHCSHYSQDITYLGQILNMNIVFQNVVFVSNKSKKYHANPHCSGIGNSQQLELAEAEKLGYVPCKKCALNIIPFA